MFKAIRSAVVTVALAVVAVKGYALVAGGAVVPGKALGQVVKVIR